MLIATARQLFLRHPVLLDSPRTRYTARHYLSQRSRRSYRHHQRNSTRLCQVLSLQQPPGRRRYRPKPHMTHPTGTILRITSLALISQMAATPRPLRHTMHLLHKHLTRPIRRFLSDQTTLLRIRTLSSIGHQDQILRLPQCPRHQCIRRLRQDCRDTRQMPRSPAGPWLMYQRNQIGIRARETTSILKSM